MRPRVEDRADPPKSPAAIVQQNQQQAVAQPQPSKPANQDDSLKTHIPRAIGSPVLVADADEEEGDEEEEQQASMPGGQQDFRSSLAAQLASRIQGPAKVLGNGKKDDEAEEKFTKEEERFSDIEEE
jgi:hypothetical protein